MNAVHGKDLVIYGDGTNTRSFQYIDDLLRGLDLMMKIEGVAGPVNLGNSVEMSVKEMAEMIIKMVGSSSRIIFEKAATDDPKQRRTYCLSKCRTFSQWNFLNVKFYFIAVKILPYILNTILHKKDDRGQKDEPDNEAEQL